MTTTVELSNVVGAPSGVTPTAKRKAIADAYREGCITGIIPATQPGCPVTEAAFDRLEPSAGKLARSVLRGRGGGNVTPLPAHIAMRVRHIEQISKGLSTRVPSHARATSAVQTELERLHWRLWHGRTDGVDVSLKRLSASAKALRKYQRKRNPDDPSRKLWAMLHELKRYVCGNAHIIVNYNRRQREGLRVSTALVESAVNHLLHRRMNKSQQMRWSTRGAHQLLQVRAAVINGEFKDLVRPRTEPDHPVTPQMLPMAA